MATQNVINIDGKSVGSIELDDTIFNATVKPYLLWEVVTAQRAARRSGNASTKERSEVRGSTRKLYKQKGTGRARHGSIRPNTFVGGGVTFGPKPRDYTQKTPKKVRRSALISAISQRFQQSQLIVLDSFNVESIKTKRVAEILHNIGVGTGLIVEDRENDVLIKSVRNLSNAKYIAPEGLNVFDVLKYEKLIITKATAKLIEERLSL